MTVGFEIKVDHDNGGKFAQDVTILASEGNMLKLDVIDDMLTIEALLVSSERNSDMRGLTSY